MKLRDAIILVENLKRDFIENPGTAEAACQPIPSDKVVEALRTLIDFALPHAAKQELKGE